MSDYENYIFMITGAVTNGDVEQYDRLNVYPFADDYNVTGEASESILSPNILITFENADHLDGSFELKLFERIPGSLRVIEHRKIYYNSPETIRVPGYERIVFIIGTTTLEIVPAKGDPREINNINNRNLRRLADLTGYKKITNLQDPDAGFDDPDQPGNAR